MLQRIICLLTQPRMVLRGMNKKEEKNKSERDKMYLCVKRIFTFLISLLSVLYFLLFVNIDKFQKPKEKILDTLFSNPSLEKEQKLDLI